MSTRNREIELKLELAPGDFDLPCQLQGWTHVRACASEHQSSVYYDTPEFALRKSGYSLRVRHADGRFVQSLKSLDRHAGFFDRNEWEQEIAMAQPWAEQLIGTPVADLSLELLRPVVRTEIDRKSCRIARSGSEVEIDLDVGTVITSNGSAPIAELEVELIRGEPRVAVDIARRIADEAPVKLAVLSKAERGFALSRRKSPKWVKAASVELHERMNTAQAFGVIVGSCLRHFRLNEPLVAEHRNKEALHQTRVAIRRLRSALALFRPAIAGGECERIEAELKWFLAESGDARNLDVYLESDLLDDQRRFILERRDDAYDRAIAATDSSRFRRLTLDVLGWSVAGEWRSRRLARQPIKTFINRRVGRLWSKVSRFGPVASMGERRRHRFRIRVKSLRYALEFADQIQHSRAKRQRKFERNIRRLQESLGSLQDIVTARALVAINPWLDTARRNVDERELVRKADRDIKGLRKMDLYW